MDTGRIVRESRARTGLTQAEFAALAGTSQPTLSQYERGRRQPTLAVLARITKAAGVYLALRVARPQVQAELVPSDRGEELQRVLELAAQFPTSHRPNLSYPRFDRP